MATVTRRRRPTASGTTRPTVPTVDLNASDLPDDSIDLPNLTTEQRNSFEMLKAVMANYGIVGLTQTIYDFLIQGYSPDTINVLIQDTQAWKDRWAGNELRRKAGIAVLSPQEYLSTEAAYRQILESNGMPVGFYDQQSDFTNWIGGDVSPSEIQKRVELAVQKTTFADQYTKDAMQQLYGVGESEIAAYFLDQSRALPLLQKRAEAIGIGSEALRRGLSTSAARAEELFGAGVTAQQAGQGYANVNEILFPTQRLAALSRMGYSQAEAENEIFGLGGGAEAGRKRKRLVGEEMARFAGGFGAQASAYGRETAGQF